MASVVLTVVGTAIGGPIGGMIGGFLGRSLDQAIFSGGRGSRTVEGRRLSDLSVQTSSYGEPIARVYGTMRLPGNVVWSSGLKERRNEATESTGGKGGGQKVTTVSYSYSASFAVVLSGRTIQDIGRIWADGKLLRNGSGKLSVGGKIRIYKGTDFQQVDPLIEALEGQGNVNGFQKLGYIVFEDLELGEFANRIPNLTFEIIADDGGEVALSTIISDICRDSELPNINASDLNQMVGGYMIPGPMQSRAVIEELAQIYHFDVVEQDNVLLFRKLGRASDITVVPDDLVQSKKGNGRSNRIILVRRQDMDLPREIGVSFIDPQRDYQTGHQRARRLNVASDIVRHNIHPLVMSSNQAKTVAEKQLDIAWFSRESINFILPHKYSDLEPGDIVTLSVGTEIQDYLLQETEISLQGIGCQAVKFSISPLDRNSVGDSGPVPGQQVEELAASQFLPLDMPTITGEDVQSPVLFWAVAAGSGKWPGSGLFISRDNEQTYQQLDYTASNAISGILENILPDGPIAYWDEGNELLVRLDNPLHSLSGETAEAVLNGANIAWVGGEIIQFKQASLEVDGRYRLTGLLRGRRGTERNMAGHEMSEVFILLTNASVKGSAMNLSDVGRTRQFKTVTTGGQVDEVVPINYSYGAEVLKPFTPVHTTGVRDSEGTLILSWIRRGRVGGDWMDYADVPLGELYEKYDIEILDGLTVVRTLTSDTTQVIYPASLQINDFGATQSSLNVRITQISDIVGRGWPLATSV